MIDAVRGVLRVRKWPKKRGTPTSAKQLFWIDWFKQANLLAKYADPIQQVRAMEMTKHSGMYPRDVLLKAMRGRLYTWVDTDGWIWFPMAAVQDVSDSLDAIAQTVGDLLVRAADRWRPITAGPINEVLTAKGPGVLPVWQAPGGGVVQGELAESPITPDGTVASYVLDVSAEFSVQLIFDTLGMAASTYPILTFSTDGGVSYKTGATDYGNIYTYNSGSGGSNDARLLAGATNYGTNHHTTGQLNNLRAGRATWMSLSGHIGGITVHRTGFARFDGPITHVKIGNNAASNFNAGTIRAVGIHSA